MDKRKKILFLVTQSEFGGAQRFIYTIVTALNGYDIVVGTGLEGDDENGLLNLLDKQGIRIERLRNLRRSINPFFDLLGLFEINRLVRKEQPDILFLCSSKAGFLGSLATALNPKSKIQNPKVIYRIGGWTFNDPWPDWKKKLYIQLEKYTARLRDVIVNNAESDRQQAINLNIKPKDNIVTIHNGINIDGLEFLPKEEARKKLKLSNHDFVVGTIANDYPAKGLKYLIKAREEFRDVRFSILSNVPNASVYLKAFDVFVLPSIKEGFPWVILEAMAAEVPVIATRVGAIPEIIISEENGLLIEPGDSKQIIEAIKRLFDNEGLRRKLAQNGKKTIIDKFNLDKMIKAYEDLFFIN